MRNISVILPVYNTRKDILDRCIASVLNQTYVDFELILIDDASVKECANIIDGYALQDERIIIARHEKNEGLSATRNTGMAIATGNYVCFVDSDDEILPDYLERYYDIMEKYDLDMLAGGYYRIYANGYTKEIKASLFERECYVLESAELLFEKLLTKQIHMVPRLASDDNAVWCKMIRMDVAKKVEFLTSIRTAEDIAYLVSLAKHLNRVGFTTYNGYKYYSYSNSLSSIDYGDLIEDREKCLSHIKGIVTSDMPSTYELYCLQAVIRFGGILLKKIISLPDIFRNRLFTKALAQRELFKEGFEGVNTKHPAVKYYYWLLIFFVRHKLWLCVNMLFYAYRLKRMYSGERPIQI